MVPRGLAIALLPLALLPGAAACSLAGQTFGQATFDLEDGDLWYVDGAGTLRRQHGALDTEVEDAFFLTYATLAGETQLIAGQDGLGADCSGQDWLELRRGGERVWRKDRQVEGDPLFNANLGTSAFPHPLGPFAQLDGRFWRLDGDDLVEAGRPTPGTWTLGFDAQGRPVEVAEKDAYVGGHRLPLTGYATAMASGDGMTAIVERIDWRITVVHFLVGDQVHNVTWTPPQGWEPTAAWSDVFVLSVGSRAYRVTATGEVTDLGVADVVAVAARGEHTAVFTEDGYTVFDGTQPIERWTRGDGTWTPAAVPQARGSTVQAEVGAPYALAEGAPPGQVHEEGRGLGIPSAGLVGLLAVVAAAAFARRKA